MEVNFVWILIVIGLLWWFSSKEYTCNAGDMGSIPGSGRSPGEGNGNPFQYSCHGQRSFVAYSLWVARVGHDLVSEHTHDSY